MDRKKVIGIFSGFLAVMLLFTILSRAVTGALQWTFLNFPPFSVFLAIFHWPVPEPAAHNVYHVFIAFQARFIMPHGI